MNLTEEELLQKLKETKTSEDIRNLILSLPKGYFTSIMEKKKKMSLDSTSTSPTEKNMDG